MNGAVCPVTAVAAATGIAGVTWAAFKSESKPTPARFASVTALIFAAQMMNFPIRDGTSGHLLGGVLASALLGTPFGVLAIALVLSVQCLLFSDGGLSVLGANILNLSLLGAGVGGLLKGHLKGGSPLSYARLGFAAWLSVVFSALSCSIELALAGAVPFSTSAPMMLGTHAVIGIVEAFITVVAFSLFYVPTTASRKTALAPAAAAILIALILSPFACRFPDGLEWVAEELGFLHASAPAFVPPLANYSFSSSLPDGLSTGLAGLVGVLVVLFASSWLSFLTRLTCCQKRSSRISGVR